ncbi:[FeFe] hydrogenase H-cluster radical SAM maturase HydE [Desulfovibrio inopinatus]|uniref:[FeFe] hydrogenase H-cluster radical SAM maturase HydE n=1 Tax=Desulfovibrio inopinatus TaxID=102109 RepID=UPI00040DB8CF|nr:[FeFe] hydrogenase H-cluster radical SAM maturase HydE [Desulfovibrio inopinatus]
MNRSQIIEVLSSRNAEDVFSQAREVRDHVFGRDVFQRGVVEFSNYCRKNCMYCGLRKSNSNLNRFSLKSDEIIFSVKSIIDLGMGTAVLQSGEDSAYSIQEIGRIITHIKTHTDLAVTLSLGDYDEDVYRFWRDCGADRYLLKMETFNAPLHEQLRPGQRVEERLRRVKLLYKLGYETGSGIITGLPGMTSEILADDLIRMRDLPLDMIAIGPFIPHPATPLCNTPPGNVDESLRAMAITRIMHPYANIPTTSALDALVSDGRERGLHAGANVVMPSATPETVRAGYSIYPGKNNSLTPVHQTIRSLQQRLKDAGYALSSSRGMSPARSINKEERRYV